MQAYHDTEWGVPCRDDRKLFEYIVLDAFQAGLSWAIIIKKREGFRCAFADFDPDRVARFSDSDVARLLGDAAIVRNRQKIIATVANAQAFLRVQQEFGSFARYLWSFVDERPIDNGFERDSDIPSSSELSDRISKDLKSRGFKFVGTTIVYAFLQGAGLINDHLLGCFRYPQVRQ